MSQKDWDNLSHVEQCFFINAAEMDILPGVRGDLDDDERRLPLDELARTLLSLVDRGWIEVRRYERWISENGSEGLTPGDVVPRDELAQVLAEPTNWEYPDDTSWIGALTLVRTETGLVISRLSPEDMAERDRA
ncbi:hypothetical protein U2F26_23885 [Micromonospora sp. 4G57]|uniref:Uncharacterized protein n=1 Tax=Micromonospora sicca TaxID=2202420 RepID=A0ABU5JGD1_9ACTN|nr:MULTISPECIES: hypothetical protein [unclassified Micromonospora]MDZ5445734.1 hypothetical protein [Micromonospora sp. 4G57]MDZ5491664.1 hypothetical protein [Micromonospora sp. 4G53]